MGTDVLKSYDFLQGELDKAKTNLKGLNENIRKIIGRDPQEPHLRGDRKRSFNDSRRNEFTNTERLRNRESSPPLVKRRSQEAKSVFSRLSGPPVRDDDMKPKVYSRVIRELPTRQEIVAAQGTDEQSKARNRRMFGCLLGTLQKFCQEESRLKEKEDMKAQVEKKLEQQAIAERENLKKEKFNLLSDRKRQQLQIRMLEQKMTRLREFEVWEKSKMDLLKFIKTRTKPYIYFKPKLTNEKTEKKLTECRSELQKEIDTKRAAVNEEIAAIEARFKTRENRICDKSQDDDTTSKHDRRNENENEEEDDDERDSIYGNSDVENLEIEVKLENIKIEKPETIIKQEKDKDQLSEKEQTNNNSGESESGEKHV